MKKELTLNQLKQSRKEFNSKIWSDYNALRKKHHLKLDTAKQEYEAELAKLQKSFIRKAVKKAGEAELSDQLILDRVQWGVPERAFIVMPESHGVIPQKIKPFHAHAMIRSDKYIEHHLFLAELYTGEPCPKPDTTELKKLEAEWEAIDEFKEVLNGKEQDLTIDESRSPPGSPAMTAIELAEHIERAYPDKKIKTMTALEALEILESQQRGNVNNFMNTEEMALHVHRQSGGQFPEPVNDLGHFGSES